MIGPGDPVPDGELGEIVADQLASFSLRATIGDDPALIVGVPGAFTPVCTYDHLPSIFNQFLELKSRGLRHNFIVSRSNPWAMAQWSRAFHNIGDFRFVSDGNLSWLRKCGLTQQEQQMYLGECCARFTMIVNGGKVTSLRVESSPMEIACTSADVILDDLGEA